MVAVASHVSAQLAAVDDKEIVSGRGSVITTEVVSVQPAPSVTVTRYVESQRPVAIGIP